MREMAGALWVFSRERTTTMRVDRLCLLSIDPARSSGWAIWRGASFTTPGRRYRSGPGRCGRTVGFCWPPPEPGPGRRGRVVVARNAQPRYDVRLRRKRTAAGSSVSRTAATGRTTSFDTCPLSGGKIAGIRSRGRVACKAEAIRTVARLYDVVADEDQAEARMGRIVAIAGKKGAHGWSLEVEVEDGGTFYGSGSGRSTMLS